MFISFFYLFLSLFRTKTLVFIHLYHIKIRMTHLSVLPLFTIYRIYNQQKYYFIGYTLCQMNTKKSNTGRLDRSSHEI